MKRRRAAESPLSPPPTLTIAAPVADSVRLAGVKVFSTTMFRSRGELGEVITRWISENPDKVILDLQQHQSSDSQFHCVSIIIFYGLRESP